MVTFRDVAKAARKIIPDHGLQIFYMICDHICVHHNGSLLFCIEEHRGQMWAYTPYNGSPFPIEPQETVEETIIAASTRVLML